MDATLTAYSEIFMICFLVATLIVVYGTIRCRMPKFYDPLTYSLLPAPWDRFFDGWGISHFGFYFMLAYLYPKHWFFITCLGVAWEALEMVFKEHPFYLSRCSYDTDQPSGASKAGTKPGWWYGRWQDIVMNSAGVALGVYLSRRR